MTFVCFPLKSYPNRSANSCCILYDSGYLLYSEISLEANLCVSTDERQSYTVPCSTAGMGLDFVEKHLRDLSFYKSLSF